MNSDIILNIFCHIAVMVIILTGISAMRFFKKIEKDDTKAWFFCIIFSYSITILVVATGYDLGVFLWAVQMGTAAFGMWIYDKVIEKWKKSNE